MPVQVTFQNVGRQKKTWTTSFPRLSHNLLYLEVRTSPTLLSKDITFAWEIGSQHTTIFAGQRPVASLKFLTPATTN